MKSSLPERDIVRQYLLGRFDEQQEERETDMSEAILLDDECSELAESVEDEIIEEYLDGTLTSPDRTAVEQYFLRPPERKEKLHFARLLRQYCKTNPTLPLLAVRPQPPAWYRNPGFYGQAFSVILLSLVSLAYFSASRKQAQLKQALVQEQQRNTILAKAPPIAESSMIALTLVEDRSRAIEKLPHIQITPSIQRVTVEIALPVGRPGSYKVSLESKGDSEPIWSARLLPLVSTSGDARLMFDVPAQSFVSGASSFVVSSSQPQMEWRKYYDFEATIIK